MEKKTPLYERHLALGGKIVPFAGWLLPVQYPSGVIKEHEAVRERAGLFDVSHMGEFLLEGGDALKNLETLLTNEFSDMEDGRVRYSPLCNERGGVVDDLIVYRFGPKKYLIVVNASNRDKDFAWMKERIAGDAALTDISDELAEIALQGPCSREILTKIADGAALPQKYYRFTDGVDVAGVKCLISRTGYTGEFGYELYAPAADAEKLWDALLDAGKEQGLIPCGLGARDTLRLEAAMPLYGHEMDDEITPLETGLGWAVKMDKPAFIGRDALIARGEPTRARVGLKMTGKGIAREHQAVLMGDRPVGQTSSGTFLPHLGGAYAMAIVDKDAANVGQALSVDVRGRKIACEVVPLPFYKREKK